MIFVISAVLWTEGVGGRYRRCRRVVKARLQRSSARYSNLGVVCGARGFAALHSLSWRRTMEGRAEPERARPASAAAALDLNPLSPHLAGDARVANVEGEAQQRDATDEPLDGNEMNYTRTPREDHATQSVALKKKLLRDTCQQIACDLARHHYFKEPRRSACR